MKHVEKAVCKKAYKILVFAILCAGMLSCKSSREIFRDANLKPIGTNRLIKSMEDSAFNYEEMELSHISCQYESKTQNVSLRGTVKAANDKAILLSFNKMNVPVGKLLLTPDSIKFINYIGKTYFTNSFSYLGSSLNLDVDFETVNAILSNNAFSYRDDKHNNDFREFTSEIDSGMYVLKSIKERKLNKVMRKGRDRKIDRFLKKLDENQFILQTLYIDSKFKLRKVILDDQFNKRMGIISFSDFMKVDKQTYPGEIDLQFISPKDNVRMKIKIGKVSMGKNQNYNFKVPDRYERVE